MQQYDIFGLVETHAGPDDIISVNNYHSYQINRPKSEKAMKYSGGMAALVKNNIKDGVRLYHSDTYAIWLELNSNFFGVNNNIYVCITYLPPENSTYSRRSNIECINVLEEQVQRFSVLGNIVILGDLNGRTADKDDYVINDSTYLI